VRASHPKVIVAATGPISHQLLLGGVGFVHRLLRGDLFKLCLRLCLLRWLTGGGVIVAVIITKKPPPLHTGRRLLLYNALLVFLVVVGSHC
jgi:hypothetical protein